MAVAGRHFLIGMLALAGGATGAQAITVQTAADLPASLAGHLFSGVGSLGRLGSNGSAGHLCTGSLISSNVVLTAAHCLDQDPAARFFLPGAGDFNQGGGGRTFSIASSMIFNNAMGAATDLAVITLSEIASGYQTYDLYDKKDEIGREVTLVGAGLTGLLSEGVTNTNQTFHLRQGVNRYDATRSAFTAAYYRLYGAEPPPPTEDDQLIFDFDSGLAENDVFGQHLGITDLGVRRDGKLIEAGIAYGDSGGPNFIDGRIAGVNSFGVTGGILTVGGIDACGTGQPGNTDTVPRTIYGCSNGSWGDFGGSVRVSFYHEQIRAYVAAAAVPEPHSWAMMIAGFGLVGSQIRRRRGSLSRVAG